MKFELLQKNRAKFTFSVTPAEFEHALEHAYAHKKDEVEVKGFRKGHVPQSVYETKFGVESLYEEALNHTIGHLFDRALAEPTLTIVSEPTNVAVDVTKISRDNPFDVSFEVDLKPEVVLGQYKGVKVAKVDRKVSSKDVEAELNSLLETGATLEPKESDTLEAGDTAIFDFEGFVDGVAFEGGKAENHSLQIGSGQFIPGFEDGMVGLKVGENRDVKVTFPAEYQAENLAGKDAVFAVKLHEIKTTKKAELTDEWVKSLEKEGIATVDELKASIKKDLETAKENQAKQQLTEAVLDKVVAAAKVDVPKTMIDREIANFVANVTNQAKQYQLELDMFLTLSGMTREQFDEQAKQQATRRVLQSLVIEEVVKQEKLEASADEIAKRYDELAKHYNMPVEEIKKYVNDQLILSDVTFEKAVELMVNDAIEE